MPSRMVDGDALWASTRVKKLPEKYRMHYANWLPLAEANGTFEADPEQIHRRVYSYLMKSVTVREVKRILLLLIDAGLVKTWDERGKTWGFFTGMEKSGRLPSKKHLADSNRYKNLPPTYPGLSRTIPLGLDVDRIGLDRTESQNSPSASPENEEEPMSVKNTMRRMSDVWQELKGKGAFLKPLDDRYGALSLFKELCSQIEIETLVEAFRLWAVELGTGDDRYPLNSFVKVADEYLRKVSPVKGFEERQVDPEEQKRIDEAIKRQREERARLHADDAPAEEPKLAPGEVF